jgi:2-oxoglutarate dehydrogenase E1 component
MHISAPARKQWLTARMEDTLNETPLDRETRLRIIEKLCRAETFESFCHTKYIGTKRFSLEGSETVIPLVDLVLEHAGRLGAIEAVLGMAHRGRLTVLTEIMGKKPREIFAEFEDIDAESTLGSGDVKYHLGYSTDHTTRGGQKLHLSLAFNPSHLEAVDPVVVGRVRGKQRRMKDEQHARVVGILLHGDAAFAGQGLVPETLNLSEIHGYRTGGTVHIIVNNQIGFTATPQEARSTPYPTDVAKMLQCPIFHVNGDHPEAVAHVVKLAMEYRAEFRCDVVIDMWCYRKYGHNESDEPAFTQPVMYRRIEQKEPICAMYQKELIEKGLLTAEEIEGLT